MKTTVDISPLPYKNRLHYSVPEAICGPLVYSLILYPVESKGLFQYYAKAGYYAVLRHNVLCTSVICPVPYRSSVDLGKGSAARNGVFCCVSGLDRHRLVSRDHGLVGRRREARRPQLAPFFGFAQRGIMTPRGHQTEAKQGGEAGKVLALRET
jgi:hypothetical protein